MGWLSQVTGICLLRRCFVFVFQFLSLLFPVSGEGESTTATFFFFSLYWRRGFQYKMFGSNMQGSYWCRLMFVLLQDWFHYNWQKGHIIYSSIHESKNKNRDGDRELSMPLKGRFGENSLLECLFVCFSFIVKGCEMRFGSFFCFVSVEMWPITFSSLKFGFNGFLIVFTFCLILFLLPYKSRAPSVDYRVT